MFDNFNVIRITSFNIFHDSMELSVECMNCVNYRTFHVDALSTCEFENVQSQQRRLMANLHILDLSVLTLQKAPKFSISIISAPRSTSQVITTYFFSILFRVLRHITTKPEAVISEMKSSTKLRERPTLAKRIPLSLPHDFLY